jgi:hypothetical protein
MVDKIMAFMDQFRFGGQNDLLQMPAQGGFGMTQNPFPQQQRQQQGFGMFQNPWQQTEPQGGFPLTPENINRQMNQPQQPHRSWDFSTQQPGGGYNPVAQPHGQDINPGTPDPSQNGWSGGVTKPPWWDSMGPNSPFRNLAGSPNNPIMRANPGFDHPWGNSPTPPKPISFGG